MLLALLLFGTVVHGCANKDETEAVASADVAAVTKTITDLAKAINEFPRARDKETVRRFATKDYVGITDGQWDNAEQIEKYLLGLLERLNLGDRIGVSYEVSGINIHVYSSCF